MKIATMIKSNIIDKYVVAQTDFIEEENIFKAYLGAKAGKL